MCGVIEISSSGLSREVLTVYSMTAVDERCDFLSGIILLGLCCSQWGEGRVVVCGFFVFLVSGRNQVDQNSAYGVSKRVLNSIQFSTSAAH